MNVGSSRLDEGLPANHPADWMAVGIQMCSVKSTYSHFYYQNSIGRAGLCSIWYQAERQGLAAGLFWGKTKQRVSQNTAVLQVKSHFRKRIIATSQYDQYKWEMG